MTKRQRINARVEEALKGVICDRCRATLDSFSEACTADLTDECPGFVAIDKAKRLAHRAVVRIMKEQTP